MRTLVAAFLSAVLLLLAAGIGFAQQSPVNSDNSSNRTDVTNSPCRANQDPDKVVHITDNVTRGLLIHKVNPSYPKAARRAHIEGTVVLCASISKKGAIEKLTAASEPSGGVAQPSNLRVLDDQETARRFFRKRLGSVAKITEAP